MKTFYLAILVLLTTITFAIGTPYERLDETDPQDVNQLNAEGRKTGKWIIYGKDKPEKKYPEEGKIEEGSYTEDRKTGDWIFYYSDGTTPKLKGTFVNGRPNGPYIKYWDNGNTKEEGKFTGGKQTDIYKTFYKDGTMMQNKKFNTDGRENGVQQFYHPNGQLEFEYTKTDGMNKGTATRYFENGDIKQIIVYNEDGTVGETQEKEMLTPAVVEKVDSGSGGPSGSSGKTKDGKKFNKDGYNKVYNDDDELWMDGKFKSAKLWDGKLYKYDSDGILEKIEIWKKGKYHSDGQL